VLVAAGDFLSGINGMNTDKAGSTIWDWALADSCRANAGIFELFYLIFVGFIIMWDGNKLCNPNHYCFIYGIITINL
jgi:hypothetical protein